MIEYNEHTHFITSTILSSFPHGFGTKLNGDGRNIQNIPFQKIAKPLQIHGDNIALVEKFDGPLQEYPDTDGLITKEIHIALIVISADCVPIIFADSTHGFIGISHQGWKGTDLKLAQKMVLTMEEHGCSTQNMRIAIGPAINQCHYPRNLIKENFKLLKEVGIKKEQVDFFPFCTFCDEKRLNSYRRARPNNFGQQFSFIMKNN